MSDLDAYRKEIDKIDRELVSLFEKRMDMVLKIAQHKKDNNLNVFHKDRENQVIEKAINNLNNKDYSEAISNFFISLMDISKEKQESILKKGSEVSSIDIKHGKIDLNKKIGYPGVPGAFSEEASIKFFGKDSLRSNYEEFEDVFIALDKGEIEYGVLPIENSSTGAVTLNYDLLRKYGFYIVGEECIKIEQNLVGIKGTSLDDIKEVYSHPQGIAQSREFLRKYSDWKLVPFSNTATSAKLVRDLGDKSKVAISSSRAAELYKLDILKRSINTEKNNYTRFIIVSKKLNVVENANKVSVVFSLENEVGTLYGLLRHFVENNINMIKIESRPSKDSSWSYVLYVDFEGDIESTKVINALKLIEENSSYFKLLGAYENKIN